MRRKADGAAESGTCNVCSAPCSSCMHLKSGYLSKSSGVSDETYHLTAMSHNSINDNQHCASENSNHASVNSNHDSLSENAESKLEVKFAEKAGASIESKSCLNMEIDGPNGIDQRENRILSINYGDSKTEGTDDNTSCVSKVHEDRTVVSYSRKNSERKSSINKSTTANGDQKVSDESLCEEVLVPNGNSDMGNLDIADKSLPKFEVEGINVQSKELLNNLEKDKGVDQNELHHVENYCVKSLPVDESGESDVVEHDVKVCDICGDAGREDLLAICSRCADGAEHTYCMREMLQKVPEGDWLCEECKVMEENEKRRQEQIVKASQDNIPKYGTRSSGPAEIVSESKQQDTETTSDSPALPGLDKKASLSKENTFKSSEKEKIKISDPPLSGVEAQDTANTLAGKLQTQRGLLGKSSSFSKLSSKPRETVGDDKLKIGGSSSTDTKDGPPDKVMSKSMSFKSVNSGRAVGSEAKVKMIPGNFSHVEGKRLKPNSDKVTFERKNSLRLDQVPKTHSKLESKGELTPRGDANSKPNISKSKDSNISRLEGKQAHLSKSFSFSSRKLSEGRTPPSSDLNPSNDSRVCPKDEPSTSSTQDSEKSARQSNSMPSEKNKDSFNNRGHRSEASNKGKEVDNSSGSSRKGSDCKLKAAIEAAMLKKPGIYKRKRENKQSDEVANKVNDAASKVNPENAKESNNDEETLDERVSNPSGLLNENTDTGLKKSTTSIVNAVQNDEAEGKAEADTPIKQEELDSVATYVENSGLSFVPPLAIPKHDYLWQGAFEVCRSGGYAEWFGGIQAHLSSFASPKVLEVVKQFPRKLSLDEVPRTCAWPTQFLLNGVKEDNIALFFFAKDVQSFERHYKGLLTNTIKNDLALKGSIDGVDLLIYPSVQLPEKSQRWNMLFFLWGVFRGRKLDNSDLLKKSITTNVDTIPIETKKEAAVDKTTPITADDSSKKDAEREEKQTSSSENRDSSVKLESSAKDSNLECSVVKEDSSAKKCSHSAAVKAEPSDSATGKGSCNLESTNMESSSKVCHPVKLESAARDPSGILESLSKDPSSLSKDPSSLSKDPPSSLSKDPPSSSSNKDPPSTSKDRDLPSSSTNKDLPSSSEDRDLPSSSKDRDHPSSSKGKDLSSCSKDEDPQSSSKDRDPSSSSRDKDPSERSGNMEWSTKDGSITESEWKHHTQSVKVETNLNEEPEEEMDTWQPSSPRKRPFIDLSEDPPEDQEPKRPRLDFGASTSASSHEPMDFFSMERQLWRQHRAREDIDCNEPVPNLELALGAEKNPFAAPKKEEDALSASLSLSLAFPFPDTNPDDKNNVSTSLFLFSRFNDK